MKDDPIRLEGRPRRLAILDYGLFRVHAGPRDIGICGYLLETDAGERVLIDTGFPARYAEDAARATAEDALGEFGEVLRLTPENLPPAQLARLGLAPSDIDLQIVSHTHIDHIGGMGDFPRAPILIAAAERALPRPLYWRGAQPMDWPAADYRRVSGDMTLGAGFEVLFCPGHAPGQLAFLIELPETGPVLLTSDAISRPSEIAERFEGSWDAALARASAARLMRLAGERGAFVIYGHSPEQWPELRKAPDVYA
jgi:N-acyl homoserine lactone hydrolase